MTVEPRRVLAYFIATGDPPVPHAIDKDYRGTFLSDSENREKARRIDREPLSVPTEHGRTSAGYVKNNVGGYVVPPEERIADIYGALVPYDNRLLVLGKIYDCPEGQEAVARMNNGIAFALSPYSESLILEDAEGNPINAFDLNTTHYGLTPLPEFSAKNAGGDVRKGTYLHDLTRSEDEVLKVLRDLHLRDHVYVTPAIQEKLGLDDARRGRLQRDFEDGIRIKRALYQKIHDEPMQPDGYDASLLALFVEPTIELTDAVPVKDSVGASVEAMLEIRRKRQATEKTPPPPTDVPLVHAEEEEEGEEEGEEVKAEEEEEGEVGVVEEEAIAIEPVDLVDDAHPEPQEGVVGELAEDPMELDTTPLPTDVPPEKLNSAPLAAAVVTAEGQLFQAPTRVQSAFADLPNLRPIVTASSLMSAPSPTSPVTSPPPRTDQPQPSVHKPFRPAPQSATPPPPASDAMDIDNASDAAAPPSPQQQQAMPEMTREEVMQKLAEISQSAKLISTGEANLDPRETYKTLTTLEGNLNVVNRWLGANGMDAASLENPADFENYMHAKREISLVRKEISDAATSDMLAFDPATDVSMFAPEKILDPHGNGYRPEQYAMLRVHASNVFSGKRRELEARLTQKSQVAVNLQTKPRTSAPTSTSSVWGSMPTNLKRRLPDPNMAESASQERPHHSNGSVFQGEAKRMQFAPLSVQSRYPSESSQPQQQGRSEEVGFGQLGAHLNPESTRVLSGTSVNNFWHQIHAKEERPSRATETFLRPYIMQSNQTVDPGTLASMQRISGKLTGSDMNFAEQLLQDFGFRMKSNNDPMRF